MSAAVQKDPRWLAETMLRGSGRVTFTPRQMRRLRKNIARATKKGMLA